LNSPIRRGPTSLGGALCALAAALAFSSAVLAAGLQYNVEIDAPKELKDRLQKGLNIVRWRSDPEMNAERLKRLVEEAVRESKEAAATEGYFSAQVGSEIDSSVQPWVVRLKLEPGERTRIDHVEIRFLGPAAEDGEARPTRERVQEGWGLRKGQPFRQEDWADAKRRAVRTLSGWRYAAAEIGQSEARIDPDKHQASLLVELESGPPFRFGELRISGTRRYPDRLVENLAPMKPGETYDRDKVTLYTRRLLESGYFASVQAEVDSQPAAAEATPLRVAVIEAPKHHFESGIGYNTDVGPKLEARYSNQDVFSSAWRFGSQLNLDEKIKNLQVNLDTPPRPGGVWNDFFARAREQDIQNELIRELSFGHVYNIGASAAPTSLITSAHFDESHIEGGPADSRQAIYFGAKKAFRRTDELVSPREGYYATVELGGSPEQLSTRSFLRGVVTGSLFFPVQRNGDLLFRGQAGVVAASSRQGIPSTFLFRTGGDQTIRGYSFESIGVEENGAIVGGRRLLLGSAEYTHWIGEGWGVAGFVDSGSAWDSGANTTIATGYGLGLRVRTPIGPIRADLAYGALNSDWRLHFSVGYGF
jgi:translocation and assembly module TamA